MPNRDFNNQPFMGIQPAINGELLNTPANNNMTRTSNTTAIDPVGRIYDSLVPSSHQEQVDYDETFHFPVVFASDDDYDEEYKAEQANDDALKYARNQLAVMEGPFDDFFNGQDPGDTNDTNDDPMSGHQRMNEAKSKHYDAYNSYAIDEGKHDEKKYGGSDDAKYGGSDDAKYGGNDGMLEDEGVGIDGLNLSGNRPLSNRPTFNDNSLSDRVGLNSDSLAGNLLSNINMNNALLGRRALGVNNKGLEDLLGYKKNEPYNPPNRPSNSPSNGAINFNTLNKKPITKNFKSNKWQGLGQRQQLKPTLSDVRNAKIQVRMPSMYYKTNQVDLVRRGNQTTDLLNSEMEP
jgi:hypothetical protein